jgi:IPT/TIG domain-containing protein
MKRLLAIAAALAVMAFLSITPVTASTPTSLVVPQGTAFTVLGHACGGINEYNFIAQFDSTNSYTKGYPDGDAYIWTTCSCGKACSTTYKAWLSTIWDFTGALVTYTVLSATPTVNPTLSLTDSHGNQIYNQTNRAYLVLAPGFLYAPRVAGLSPASGPQGMTITINGTGFTGATAVKFGKLPAVSFTINSDTSITTVTPAIKTATLDVTVTSPGGTSARNPSDKFTFTLQPRVGSISPTSGTTDGGTTVTIIGDNFTAATWVGFGGIPATSFKVITSRKLTAVSPAGPDSGVTGDVVVGTSYGYSATSAADLFTWTG